MAGVAVKVAGVSAVILATAAVGAAGYLFLGLPSKADPPHIQVDATPPRIERGRYLYQLADCDGCHAERDFSRFAGPVVASGKGMAFPPEMGLPGAVVAPNITPDKETGIGAWTDGEKIRAIRDGIGRDGRPLFPMMPYAAYREMSDEDVYSLVAYLKTLQPIRNSLPPSKVAFPVSALMRMVPRPAGRVPEPDRNDKEALGKYLVTVGACAHCHTPEEGGREVKGMAFAGGRVFRMPVGSVVSPNITPDPYTGIGRWTEDDFVARFHQYRNYLERGAPTVTARESFTLMPWLNLARLTDGDLRAMYAYLRTVPPVYHSVETHPAALAQAR